MQMNCPFCNSPVMAEDKEKPIWYSHEFECQECGTKALIDVRGFVHRARENLKQKIVTVTTMGDVLRHQQEHQAIVLARKVTMEYAVNALRETVLKRIQELENPNEIRGYN